MERFDVIEFLIAGVAARRGLVAAVLLRAGHALAAPINPATQEFPLWPGVAPGSETSNLPAKDYAEIWLEEPGRDRVKGIVTPTLGFFPPNAAKANGVALIIAPGGGYSLLAINHEGWQVAQRFAAEGIACFVLKYRHFDREIALRDAHRAVRVVRSRAAEWKIDPRRVGFGGFSAGGHLAQNAAANNRPPQPWPLDAIDHESNRIDFLMLIYPSGIERVEGAVVDAQIPPVFLASSSADRVAERVLPLLVRLTALSVRYDAHVFADGSHGGGMFDGVGSISGWPALFLTWLNQQIAPSGGMKAPHFQPAAPRKGR
jgi:acetyl esterase/lipase